MFFCVICTIRRGEVNWNYRSIIKTSVHGFMRLICILAAIIWNFLSRLSVLRLPGVYVHVKLEIMFELLSLSQKEHSTAIYWVQDALLRNRNCRQCNRKPVYFLSEGLFIQLSHCSIVKRGYKLRWSSFWNQVLFFQQTFKNLVFEWDSGEHFIINDSTFLLVLYFFNVSLHLRKYGRYCTSVYRNKTPL